MKSTLGISRGRLRSYCLTQAKLGNLLATQLLRLAAVLRPCFATSCSQRHAFECSENIKAESIRGFRRMCLHGRAARLAMALFSIPMMMSFLLIGGCKPKLHDPLSADELLEACVPGNISIEANEWERWVFTGQLTKHGSPTDRETQLASLAKGAVSFNTQDLPLDELTWTALVSAPSLKYLTIGDGIRQSDLDRIGELIGLEGILFRNSETLRIAKVSMFNELKGLKSVHFSSSVVIDDPLSWKAWRSSELAALSVGDSDTDEFVPEPGQFPNLEHYHALFSRISDDGVEKLVASCPKLKYLNLGSSSKITHESVATLGKLKNLRYLEIGGTAIHARVYDLQRMLPNCYIGNQN